jgi:hypothetical protein
MASVCHLMIEIRDGAVDPVPVSVFLPESPLFSPLLLAIQMAGVVVY